MPRCPCFDRRLPGFDAQVLIRIATRLPAYVPGFACVYQTGPCCKSFQVHAPLATPSQPVYLRQTVFCTGHLLFPEFPGRGPHLIQSIPHPLSYPATVVAGFVHRKRPYLSTAPRAKLASCLFIVVWQFIGLSVFGSRNQAKDHHGDDR